MNENIIDDSFLLSKINFKINKHNSPSKNLFYISPFYKNVGYGAMLTSKYFTISY